LYYYKYCIKGKEEKENIHATPKTPKERARRSQKRSTYRKKKKKKKKKDGIEEIIGHCAPH